MSSVNPYPTFEYSQPDEYRFSHDSVFLARRVFELLREEIKPDWRVLDLCAGSGIIGMDFLFHCRQELGQTPSRCDFLEVQDVYRPHFATNIERLNLPDTEMRFLHQNYNQPLSDQYDLILCNPPYFDPREGKPSPSQFKNRCRFFIDATQADLIHAIAAALTARGRAYVLTRSTNPPQSPDLNGLRVGDIRGTPLIRYQRQP